jgi:hypothetical protein
MNPSSFCTVATKQCKHELIALLLSLAYYHPKSVVYIICDTITANTFTMNIDLECKFFIKLDEYSNLSRQQMTEKGIWGEFQMSKATAIEYALRDTEDTLFLDCDVIFLEPIKIPKGYSLGVSRGYINNETSNKVGLYNGGFLWTNQKNLPIVWRQYTQKSRYYDQASIEDLTYIYSFFEFIEQTNFQSWRFIVGEEPNPEKYFTPTNKHILYKEKRLQSIHTHFTEARFQEINKFFIQQLSQAKMFHVIEWISRIS